MYRNAPCPKTHDDRAIRIKIASKYCASPYINLWATEDAALKQKKKEYRAYKRAKNSEALLNIGTEIFVNWEFFSELEQPSVWMTNDHIDGILAVLSKRRNEHPSLFHDDIAVLCVDFFAKLLEAWKEIHPNVHEPFTSHFDPLAFNAPDDWILYGTGEKPSWGKRWTFVKTLLIPCAVGNPDGHWILCKVNLSQWSIVIYDSLTHKVSIDATYRENQVALLRYLLPSVLAKSGYFEEKHMEKRGDIFTVQMLNQKSISTQKDNNSCGGYVCKYIECISRKGASWNWGSPKIQKMRREYAFAIFCNAVDGHVD